MSGDDDLEPIYQRNLMELFTLTNGCNSRKFDTPQEKLAYMRELWGTIEDLVHQQRRNLDYRAGEHKPETLHSSVMLEGRFGDIFE